MCNCATKLDIDRIPTAKTHGLVGMAVVCNFRLKLQSVDSLYGNMKDADVIDG